jgi:hypothetical protein
MVNTLYKNYCTDGNILFNISPKTFPYNEMLLTNILYFNRISYD